MALDKDLLRNAARDAVPVAAGGRPPPRARRPAPRPAPRPPPESPGSQGPLPGVESSAWGWRAWLSLFVIAALAWSWVDRRDPGKVAELPVIASPADETAAQAPEVPVDSPPVYDPDPPDPGAPLWGDDILAAGVSRVPTLAGLLRIVPRASGAGEALELDGAAVEGIAGDEIWLARRLTFADREVVVGFTGCNAATPACALRRPFWLVLRPGEAPEPVQAPGLWATVEAGAVSADATGVAVDLGVTGGERSSATLTRRDLLHLQVRPAAATPLSAGQCATVARALEDCTRAELSSCATPEGSSSTIGADRRLALAYLFHHTAGFHEPAFVALCARSCELGATPSDKLVREELCSGADPAQWGAPTLPWLMSRDGMVEGAI